MHNKAQSLVPGRRGVPEPADVETTGFSYNGADRIVELSIISIDPDGRVLDTFDTLVNPKRDVGASKIHGITPEMVREAPTFDEIADSVLEINDHSVIVAHNAVFDTNFLKKGLIVKSGVSKKLDMLVVADPHTQSNKAKRARKLDVKIVAEPVFWRMIGVSVE